MLKKLLALFAMVSLIVTLSLSQAANAAQGEPGPPPGKGEDTTPNSLSVPVINVDTTTAPFACTSAALVMPSGTQIYYPTGFENPITTPPEGGTLPLAGNYYIQGEATWQAECGTTTTMLNVTGDWGDNLGGDAKLSVGAPVRVEVGLMVDTATHTDYAALKGFEVVKLTEELDRYATYGTLGVAEDLDEVRAYDDGARLRILSGTTAIYDATFAAELNSTGRIVYGYNWRPTAAGDYTLEFTAPAVKILNGTDDHTFTINVTVDEGTGGGGGGNGGGGGKPTLPGSQGGKLPVTVDGDRDRVPDASDNCGGVKNPAQKDKDGDGIGNKCDSTPKG